MASQVPPPRSQMPSSFDGDPDFATDNRWSKFKRLIINDPLVPIGCLFTIAALVGASRAMRRNDHATANKMFRRRIYAQGFTIVAIVLGSSYFSKDKEQRKREKEEEKERIGRERREKWLEELDFRDQEEKEQRREMEGRRRRARETVLGGGKDAVGKGGVGEAVKGLMWKQNGKGEGEDEES